MSGSAADLGTAAHEALQIYVESDAYKTPDKKKLLEIWESVYWNYFSDRTRYDEGATMLGDWYERNDLLDGREILSTEVKESFNIPTSEGDIPFNFIWDRADRLPDGTIEVVDYKSTAIPVTPEDLKHKIQPRAYALAAAIKYPEAPAVWVSFDLLRFDTVGMLFTREDNIETWKYLKALAERIIADDTYEERLNPECRFCVRKLDCETLQQHSRGGGSLSISDFDQAINMRAKLNFAKAALDNQINDLDQFLLEKAEREDIKEHKTDLIKFSISVGSRRWIDSQRAAKVIGPERMLEYGSLQMKQVDALLKDKSLDSETRSELRQLVRKKFNQPTVKTTPINPLTDE